MIQLLTRNFDKLNFLDNIVTQKFNVTDVPKAVLALGSSLNGSNIKEGDDVYFECGVRANPRPYKITWRKNVSFCHFDSWMDSSFLSGETIVAQYQWGDNCQQSEPGVAGDTFITEVRLNICRRNKYLSESKQAAIWHLHLCCSQQWRRWSQQSNHTQCSL